MNSNYRQQSRRAKVGRVFEREMGTIMEHKVRQMCLCEIYYIYVAISYHSCTCQGAHSGTEGTG